MLRKRRIAFLGDSNSRFHWMTFNWFLDTGKLRVPRGSKYDKRGHRGPPDYACGTGRVPRRASAGSDTASGTTTRRTEIQVGSSRAAASYLQLMRRMYVIRPRAWTSTGTASGSA